MSMKGNIYVCEMERYISEVNQILQQVCFDCGLDISERGNEKGFGREARTGVFPFPQ